MPSSNFIYNRLSQYFASKILSYVGQLVTKIRFLSGWRRIVTSTLWIPLRISLLISLRISLRISSLSRISLWITLRITLRGALWISLWAALWITLGSALISRILTRIRIRLARISRLCRISCILSRIPTLRSLSFTRISGVSSINCVGIDSLDAFLVCPGAPRVTRTRRISSRIRRRIGATRITTGAWGVARSTARWITRLRWITRASRRVSRFWWIARGARRVSRCRWVTRTSRRIAWRRTRWAASGWITRTGWIIGGATSRGITRTGRITGWAAISRP